MIALAIGCLLLGGGFKGMIDDLIKPAQLPANGHSPVRSS